MSKRTRRFIIFIVLIAFIYILNYFGNAILDNMIAITPCSHDFFGGGPCLPSWIYEPNRTHVFIFVDIVIIGLVWICVLMGSFPKSTPTTKTPKAESDQNGRISMQCSCGAEVQSVNRYCTQCGRELDTAGHSAPPPVSTPSDKSLPETSLTQKRTYMVIGLLASVIMFIVIIFLTIEREWKYRKPSEPIMVLAYMIETPRTGEGNDQCIRVSVAGFTNEPVVTTRGAIMNGTFNPEPKLQIISESGIPYKVTSSELNEMLKNNPDRTISFELIKGRRADLDSGSRAVVNDVLNSFPGLELRDAQDHSNWIPFNLIGDEPAPGYSASDCHTPLVPKIGAINEASPTPSAPIPLSNPLGIRVATDALIDDMKALVSDENAVITSSDLLLLTHIGVATTPYQFVRSITEQPSQSESIYDNKLVLISGTVHSDSVNITNPDQASITLPLNHDEHFMGDDMTVYLSKEGTKDIAAIESDSRVTLVCEYSTSLLQNCITFDQHLEHIKPVIETEVQDFLLGELHLPRVLGVTIVAVYILGTELPSDSPCATKNDNCPTFHPDLSIEANQALIEKTVPIAIKLRYICTQDELKAGIVLCAN